MSPSKGTARRTIRVSDELWEQASARAADDGRHLSEVIREFLEAYAGGMGVAFVRRL